MSWQERPVGRQTPSGGLLLQRQRPSIDRADELCGALGITMTIGDTPTDHGATDGAGTGAESGRDQ